LGWATRLPLARRWRRPRARLELSSAAPAAVLTLAVRSAAAAGDVEAAAALVVNRPAWIPAISFQEAREVALLAVVRFLARGRRVEQHSTCEALLAKLAGTRGLQAELSEHAGAYLTLARCAGEEGAKPGAEEAADALRRLAPDLRGHRLRGLAAMQAAAAALCSRDALRRLVEERGAALNAAGLPSLARNAPLAAQASAVEAWAAFIGQARALQADAEACAPAGCPAEAAKAAVEAGFAPRWEAVRGFGHDLCQWHATCFWSACAPRLAALAELLAASAGERAEPARTLSGCAALGEARAATSPERSAAVLEQAGLAQVLAQWCGPRRRLANALPAAAASLAKSETDFRDPALLELLSLLPLEPADFEHVPPDAASALAQLRRELGARAAQPLAALRRSPMTARVRQQIVDLPAGAAPAEECVFCVWPPAWLEHAPSRTDAGGAAANAVSLQIWVRHLPGEFLDDPVGVCTLAAATAAAALRDIADICGDLAASEGPALTLKVETVPHVIRGLGRAGFALQAATGQMPGAEREAGAAAGAATVEAGRATATAAGEQASAAFSAAASACECTGGVCAACLATLAGAAAGADAIALVPFEREPVAAAQARPRLFAFACEPLLRDVVERLVLRSAGVYAAAAAAFGTAGAKAPDPLAGWTPPAAEGDGGKAFLARCGSAAARATNAAWRAARTEAARHQSLKRQVAVCSANPGAGLRPVPPSSCEAGYATVAAALAEETYGEALLKMAGFIALQAAYKPLTGKTTREENLVKGRAAYAELGLRAAPPGVATLLGLPPPAAPATPPAPPPLPPPLPPPE